MKAVFVQPHAASFVSAVVFLLLISHAFAGEADDKNRRPIEVSFTKWVTIVDGFRLLDGFTGGDVVGDFVGEVLQRQVSFNGSIVRLEATYGVQAGERSFTALIRGGSNAVTGAAILDGVILAGWRTGAQVHVEFQMVPAPSPKEPGCDGAPAGLTCFQGTIHVGRAPER